MLGKNPPNPVLTVLFLGVISLAFWVMWGSKFSLKDPPKKDSAEQAEPEVGPIFSLNPVVVELSGKYLRVIPGEEGVKPALGVRKKVLGMAIDLEFKDKLALKDGEKQVTQIQTVISEIAASKNAKDIQTPEGKAALGAEIAAGVNRLLQGAEVRKVYFREFIVL